MSKEINVLAMVKGEERYIFLYDDERRVETLRMLGRYAADPQLSFSWYDAAVLSKKIRETAAAVDAGQLTATPLPSLPSMGTQTSGVPAGAKPERMVTPRFTLPQ